MCGVVAWPGVAWRGVSDRDDRSYRQVVTERGEPGGVFSGHKHQFFTSRIKLPKKPRFISKTSLQPNHLFSSIKIKLLKRASFAT